MSGYQKRRVCVIPADILTSEELYRSEVRQLPQLTIEEERELVRRAREGDADARTALITSCLNYVGFMACTGYIEYPFENELGKICLENIASDVEKEEKIV
jgi:DNA-directed RNA polymerase sigma subunit (sigma70/sigma32)